MLCLGSGMLVGSIAHILGLSASRNIVRTYGFKSSQTLNWLKLREFG